MLFLLLVLLSCKTQWYTDEFPRDRFENSWWEILEEEPPICFNVHETGELLTYSGRINSEGEWMFSDPNIYNIEGQPYDFEVYLDTNIDGKDCWKIDASILNISACQCTIIEWLE